ncbi:MAG: ribosomal RNA small subunit methyltransferase A [Candidatus Pacebacteria bacterium]|nr:ribosomal RNA small subunit methyltransferase A [Candidatus Paceibacterota bacterium]
MQAKKHLGQHFLTSQKALFDMVQAGDINSDDLVLEIGPGKGVLTEKLLSLARTVLAIEKDVELIPLLKEKFEKELGQGRLEILPKDILLFNPEILKEYNKPYKLIANIPYYITGAIIEQFLSASHQPSKMVLLIQKEVAERIIARDQLSGNLGGKQSILSIAVSVYGTPKIVSKVPAGAFFPPPKVDSAIIVIDNISRDFFKEINLPAQAGEKTFFRVLKHCFGKKRKQILGSLADYLENKDKAISILQKADISEKSRPEDLSKEDWGRITQYIEE